MVSLTSIDTEKCRVTPFSEWKIIINQLEKQYQNERHTKIKQIAFFLLGTLNVKKTEQRLKNNIRLTNNNETGVGYFAHFQ